MTRLGLTTVVSPPSVSARARFSAAACGRVAFGRLQPPEHLRPHVRLPAGDDHGSRRAAPVAIVDGSGRGQIVIDIDVKGGERKKIFVLAPTERRGTGLAQCLADVKVLAGFSISVTARATS